MKYMITYIFILVTVILELIDHYYFTIYHIYSTADRIIVYVDYLILIFCIFILEKSFCNNTEKENHITHKR